MKRYTPLTIIKYLSIEFLSSLFIVFLVFLSLSLLINFVEEMSFFKDKKIENFIWVVSYLTIYKTPNTLIDLSIFIFLFSGILFFVKTQKKNELNTILLSGISKLPVVLTPAFVSLFFGLAIIFLISPVSSTAIKFYEQFKRVYASNENLIVINNTGLWFMETLPKGYNIIRADKISNNDFSQLKNITIYSLDQEFNFIKRFDSNNASVKNKNWTLTKPSIISDKEEKILQQDSANFSFTSTIELSELKEYFSSAATVSFWDISKSVEILNLRGYSADELKVKFHKYLSLPIYLFGMILLSTLFTIGINKEYNMFMYLFFGLILGFFLYFLNDLSIAIGLSNKLPLNISVWSPVIIIIFLSTLNLLKINDK